MARTAGAVMRQRPLSPHLSIYRFRYTLTTSIANRVTGAVLSIALPLLVAWLMSAASGAERYEAVRSAFGHPAGRIVLAGLLVAWLYHLLAGIRHLIWDTGHGLERAQAQLSAWLLGGLWLLGSAALLYVAFSGGAR
jgi:succinate dehydrogenase / fumarate reductase, cytochrome b subunit